MKSACGVLVFACLLLAALRSADAGTITGTVTCTGVRDNADVVVFVEKAEGAFPPSAEHAQMDQKGMKFIPHVLPIVAGTTVDYLNSDNVMHNVYTPDKVADKFNLGTWPQGQTRSYTFAREGVAVMLCNVHPEMEAWVVVLQNPYFAVTVKDGTYRIADVPAGTYTVKLWHEKLKKYEARTVGVPADGEAVVDFTLTR